MGTLIRLIREQNDRRSSKMKKCIFKNNRFFLACLMLGIPTCGERPPDIKRVEDNAHHVLVRQEYRKTREVSASSDVLGKLIGMCQINNVNPSDLILTFFSEYATRPQLCDGFYSLYVNAEKGIYSMSGDDEFFGLVEKFILAIERNPDVKIEDMDYSKSINFSKTDPILRKMGFVINMDR
jgi:hypothetical protein